MAAPERFAESQICSCTAGTVHTWPKAAFAAAQSDVRFWEHSDRHSFGGAARPDHVARARRRLGIKKPGTSKGRARA